MKSEAIITLEHYLRNESNTVRFFGSDFGVNMFSDFLQNGETIGGDAPDMVLLKGNTAIVVEHFEFDSSYTNKKGSSSRIEQARVEREQRQKLATLDSGVYHGTIKTQFSYQNLIENVEKSFLHHYDQIDTYKQNLIQRNIVTSDTHVKIMFMVSDVSPIGCIAIDNTTGSPKTIPVTLAQSPEFLDIVERCKGVDYVLCCSYACDSEYIWFIDRNDLSSYRENQCDFSNMRFLSNPPHVVIGKVTIPDKRGGLEES